MPGRAQDVDTATGDLQHEEQHRSDGTQAVSTVKKSHARTPAACARRNVIQEVSNLRGAGSTPAWCRIRQTVAARASGARVLVNHFRS
jgi:hypothetical protein